MKTTVSHSTRRRMLSHGTAQQQPIQILSTQIHAVRHDVHHSLNSMTGTAMVSSTGKTSMMTMMESSIFSTLTGIVIWITTEIFTLSMVHCTVMTVQTLLTQILTETVSKTILTGTTTMMDCLTCLTLMTETAVQLTPILTMHSQPPSTQLEI